MIELRVDGIPAPKGSYEIVDGRLRSKGLVALLGWERAVSVVAERAAADVGEFGGAGEAVWVGIVHFMPRPARVVGGGCEAWTTPDLDKVTRATIDGLAPLIPRDERITALHARAVWGTPTGALVVVDHAGSEVFADWVLGTLQ